MARIETNTNLVGKTIVLIDGTKSKIIDAIASGYKVKGRTARIATRCIVKEGAHFKEIERMSMTQLEDTGEGYVKIKDAKATKKPATKKEAAKSSAKKADKKADKKKPSVEEKAPKVRRRKGAKSESDDSYQNLAKAIIEGGRAKPAVEIEMTDEALTDAVAKRLVSVIENSDIAKVCADNKTPIANALQVTYGGEFAADANVIQITLNLQYAKPVAATGGAIVATLDADLQKRAAKLAAKKVGKVLAKAIKEAFDLEDANELLQGTVLHTAEGEEFLFIGESAKHAGKALMFSTGSQSFKSFSGSKLSEFEIVEDNELSDDEEEADEEEEEEEEELEEEENEDASDSDDEYEYVAVNKDQLDMVNKKVTAKYHADLAERFNTTEDVLIPGLVLTDGETTFAYLGCDSKGGLLVIDCGDDGEGEDVLLYAKAQVKELEGFNPVLGSSDDADAADDFEGEDDEEDNDADDSDDEDNDDDSDDGDNDDEDNDDDDFEFDEDTDSEDLDDLSVDELRDRVVHQGLTTPRKAAKMDEDELRDLLA